MALTSTCGPHCGIRANAEDTMAREAHCSCGDPCHPDGNAPPSRIIRQAGPYLYPPSQPFGLDGKPLHGIPMCESWQRDRDLAATRAAMLARFTAPGASHA